MPLGTPTKSAARPKVYVLTTLLPLGPGGPPAKVLLPSVYRPAIALLLGKKRDATASPNLRAPQAPSVRVRALASRVADELRGRLALAVSRGAYSCNMSGGALGPPNPLGADHAGGQVCARRPAPLSCDMTHGLTT